MKKSFFTEAKYLNDFATLGEQIRELEALHRDLQDLETPGGLEKNPRSNLFLYERFATHFVLTERNHGFLPSHTGLPLFEDIARLVMEAFPDCRIVRSRGPNKKGVHLFHVSVRPTFMQSRSYFSAGKFDGTPVVSGSAVSRDLSLATMQASVRMMIAVLKECQFNVMKHERGTKRLMDAIGLPPQFRKPAPVIAGSTPLRESSWVKERFFPPKQEPSVFRPLKFHEPAYVPEKLIQVKDRTHRSRPVKTPITRMLCVDIEVPHSVALFPAAKDSVFLKGAKLDNPNIHIELPPTADGLKELANLFKAMFGTK